MCAFFVATIAGSFSLSRFVRGYTYLQQAQPLLTFLDGYFSASWRFQATPWTSGTAD